ncbi:MAG TPA: ATP-dependent DNA helicase RecG [Verrucomicrobiae bacterium]|nr:ATP-dependent DNA helicase RecG [Verrucomicrobiae bacterium]
MREPVTTLPGVGKERAERLRSLGIVSIEDLLLHRPRRYEDRRQVRAIRDLQMNSPSVSRGIIVSMGVKWFARHSRSIFEMVLDDGAGRLHCRWWNQPFLEKNFSPGEEVIVFGKLKSLRPKTMEHPETEAGEAEGESSIHVNRIVPVHPLTEGISARWLRSLIWRALEKYNAALTTGEAGQAANLVGRESPRADSASVGRTYSRAALPQHPSIPTPLDALTRQEAIRFIHFPQTLEQAELARQRLAFDEFLALQTGIRQRRARFEAKSTALPCGGNNRLIKPFLARLGFTLTEAQTSVLKELRRDMSAAHPMRRLLQGDVGSGKTVVAACCALMAIETGYEAALMAPTEILAQQHWQTLRAWLAPLGIEARLLTGAIKTPRANNAPSLVVGTHALIESGYEPEKLGLVIIDEQHRFGVAQREKLVRKGNYPHLLVMTATPIPRTLGLTLYGELDISVMKGLPPGRGPVRTAVRRADRLPQVWDFIKSRLREGRQAYVIYPRIEEDDKGLKAVTSEFARIEQTVRPFRAGMMHGRMAAPAKEEVMTAFRDGRIHVLLATSLIEVGVDVPNAAVMLIENADQFGLAQLHQLRGRIGRGAHESWCILVPSGKSEEGRRRLEVLERTADGFEIAEADLKLRGPGELLGRQQSGMPDFRFGDLQKDYPLIQQARRVAAELPLAGVQTPGSGAERAHPPIA